MNALSLDQLKKWYKDHYDETLKDFFTFLSFPSISTDPHYEQHSRRTAEWLCNYMNKIGLDTTLWETPGLPVVFGTHMKAGKDRPTLLIYHHYDVQPVDPIDLWKSDPFKPVIRNNQVYARGAVDNKGQCFYSLTALKACIEMAGQFDFNIKVFIEGEEESGGRGTAAILQQKETELRADHLLVIDFDIPSAATPGITLGMRGLVALDVECSNSAIDLHSGVHGGIALNPNRALATILAGMWDKDGKVSIPHFYDDVRPLSKDHLSKVDMSFDEEQYKKSFGVKSFCMEEGCTIKESNWLRPALEINGMSGGYTGIGFKTVIPAKAHAKISCRLVPEQDPEKIGKAITQYLKSSAPKGIEIKVDLHHGAPAYRSEIDSSIVKTAALAYEEIFGKPCKYLFCGASVPIVVDLVRASKAQVAMIGVGLPDDDIHAPNEHFGLDRFELGYLTIGRILSRLSTVCSGDRQ
ncbi:MAG: dipeptidase [Verrucomicrobia bacterium]|nr:dipeptidase [Verrucomicrobiota bacterium]